MFTDTFSAAEAEADSHACRFEHVISPELDQRICTFLGHPMSPRPLMPFPLSRSA